MVARRQLSCKAAALFGFAIAACGPATVVWDDGAGQLGDDNRWSVGNSSVPVAVVGLP